MTATFDFDASVADVRAILELNAEATSKYTDQQIQSNLYAAAWRLENATGRIFHNEPALEMKFTTHQEPWVYLPGLRSASSVTLNGSTLTADDTYKLVPDPKQTGVHTAIALRSFTVGGSDPRWYLHHSDWFDRNLDSRYWTRYGGAARTTIANDLVINGAWGYTDTDMPWDARGANARLAAFLTLRGDVLLSGARATDRGVFDLSQWPIEVQAFVSEWQLGQQAVSVGS